MGGTQAAGGEQRSIGPCPVVCCGMKEAVSEPPDKLRGLHLVTYSPSLSFSTTTTVRVASERSGHSL